MAPNPDRFLGRDQRGALLRTHRITIDVASDPAAQSEITIVCRTESPAAEVRELGGRRPLTRRPGVAPVRNVGAVS